uniref:Transmembrane protein n=1 Tax=Macrostomum lignano TaxID=282301 RepID=A0A1I8IXW7_9PLAT
MFFGGGRDGSEFRLTGAQRIYLATAKSTSAWSCARPSARSRACWGCPPSCMYCKSLRTWLDKEDSPIVLEHLLESNVFADAFAMHDAQTSDRRSGRRAAAAAAPAAASLEDADTKSDNGGGDSRDGWRLNLDLRYQLSRSCGLLLSLPASAPHPAVLWRAAGLLLCLVWLHHLVPAVPHGHRPLLLRVRTGQCNRRPAYVLRKSRCQPIWCTQQTTRRKCIGFYSCVLSCVSGLGLAADWLHHIASHH